MTTIAIERIRKFLTYCITTFIIFLLSLLLMISYEFYVKIVNNKNTNNKTQTTQKTVTNKKPSPQINVDVERLNHVKVGYKEENKDNPHVFVIDVLKIGKCKYILVHSHINNYTDIELAHANDCEECKVSEKNYHEISKQLLELISKKELEKAKEDKGKILKDSNI